MPTDQTLVERPGALAPVADRDRVPDYLHDHYSWAYLHPASIKVFDHPIVVSAILWGNYQRLMAAALTEARSGDRALQIACAYGDFSRGLAETLAPDGRLTVIDAVPIQVDLVRRKLAGFEYMAEASVGNAATPPEGPFDLVYSFFLLHEVPEDYKVRIVNAVLDRVEPDGKAVFIDYHRPAWYHPLRPLMNLVLLTLEPFALALWDREIRSYAHHGDRFIWSKETYFGGLYQKIVAVRRTDA